MSSIICHESFTDVVKNTEHLSGNIAFQAADSFCLSLSFFYPPTHVEIGAVIVTQPDQHYPVDGSIRLAIAAAVETVAVGFA